MGKRAYLTALKALIFITLYPLSIFGQTEIKPISSKDVFDHFDQLYMIDSRLVNGDFYQTPKMSESTGHPYYTNPGWKTGTLSMEGVFFDSLLLRYDIFSDQLILNTSNLTNSAIQVVLKKSSIEYFTMDGMLFEPYPITDPDRGLRFCQVLVSGSVDFLLVKSKKLKVTPGGLSDFVYQEYTGAKLRYKGEIINYSGRGTIQKLFPELRPVLREYLKNARLKFRRMSLDQHRDYLIYCNSLLEGKR